MQLRNVPPSFSCEITARIDEGLSAIERAHGVSIPLAIESGSRAWGFPSPDSDYDCRFIFVRSVNDYLSPWPKPDGIEMPLEGMLDVNGWDLAKALKLLIKGNAVVIEWLMSPIVYCGEQRFRDELLDLASQVADRRLIGRHYLHLGERQRRTYFGDGKEVQQKKIFYALRPAATLRWLRMHPNATIAPMDFPTLMKECDPPRDVAAICTILLERKAHSRELGIAPLSRPLADFIDAEFESARVLFEEAPRRANEAARRKAEAYFVEIVRRLDGLRFA